MIVLTGGFLPFEELVQQVRASPIPIVFLVGGDPVRVGLVASMNRPGGNVTAGAFCVLASAGAAEIDQNLCRPSILAMVWLRPPPWVQSEVVTPIGLLVICRCKFGRSAAEVLEVFHQPLEAIISLRNRRGSPNRWYGLRGRESRNRAAPRKNC